VLKNKLIWNKMKITCEHHQDCMHLIQKILDGEANHAEKQRFFENKDQCVPCQKGYELEISLKRSIKSTCQLSCPEQIINKIREKLFLLLILISILIPLFC
jgi:ferredoxin